MSILESVVLGLLFGSVFKLLQITKEQKERIEKLENRIRDLEVDKNEIGIN